MGADQTICQGQTATLLGPPGYSNYLWSNGANTQNITVSSAGDYWCEVSYPSGQLVTNGNFNAGNTGFTTEWTYGFDLQPEGTYTVGPNAAFYHPQFSGTGSGNFLIVNAGWGSYSAGRHDVWCQNVTVCPQQTYTLTYRGRTISAQNPARVQWMVDGVATGPEVTLPSQGGGWQTFNTTWTSAPGQTSAGICLRITSGDGIGNDLGLDDIGMSGTIVLRDTVHVFVTPLPVVNINNLAVCQGQQATFNATTANATYLWQDGSTGPTYTTSTAGPVSVQVTVNGCSNSDNAVLIVNPYPVVDLGPAQTICAGDVAVLNAITPGATYSWQDGSNSPIYNATITGTYDVDVTVNGCTTNDAVGVTVTPLPVIDLGLDQTICDGDVAVLDATTANATYVWQDGSTNATFNATTTGTYDVDVTVSGCTSNDAVDVTVNPMPVVDLGLDRTICAGDVAVLDATTANATYVWQDGSTNATFNATTTGTYDVDVTVNGCTTNDAVDVTVDPLPVVDLGLDQAICIGDVAILDATTPNATYVWQDGSTNATFNATTTGTYDVDVTVNGCTSNDAVDVTVNPLPVVDLGPTQTICAGDVAVLDATTASATYVWQNGSTNATFNATIAGTYNVDVTVNGCTTNDVVDVVVNALPVVDLGPAQTICEGGVAVLDATTPNATYLWQDGSTSATFNATTTGAYDVDVTVNGCTTNDAVNVTVTPLPVFDLGAAQSICQGDVAVLDATTPNATYLWQDGSTGATFNATSTGTYDVDVTVNGCTANDVVNVTVNQMPVVDLGPPQAICIGQSVMLDATTTGATYLWQDGSTSATFDVTLTGTYTVNVTVNGCTTTDATNVTVNQPPLIDIGVAQFICEGDVAVLDATTPGATYLWQDGSTNAIYNATTTGTYDVEVTLNGCTSVDDVDVTVTPAPIVDIGDDLTICPGDVASFDATTANATYLWQDGSTGPTYSTSTPGNISVQVTVNGCSSMDALVLSNFNLQTVNLGSDVTACVGDIVPLSVNVPGASYGWNTGATSNAINATTQGWYWVDASMNGCSVRDSVYVTFNPLPLVNLGPTQWICPENQAFLNATTAGATYLWNNGSTGPTLTVGQGPWSVEVTVNGCTSTDAVNVNLFASPALELGNDTTLCPDQTLLLDASGIGYSYSWQNGSGSNTQLVTLPGVYSVQVSDNNDCTANDAITVNYATPNPVDIGNDTTICQGTQLLLDGTTAGATAYSWNNGSTGATLLVSGTSTYWVDVWQVNCLVTDSISLVTAPAPVFSLGNDTTLCPGATLDLAVPLGNVTYQWQDGSGNSTYQVSSAGVYSVTVTDANLCAATDAISVFYADPSAIELGPDVSICEGNSLTLDATLPGSTYEWSTGAQTPIISVSTTGTYWVEATQSGCLVSDTIDVNVAPMPQVDLGNDTTLCAGADLVLNASWPGATTTWNNGSNATSLTVNSPGTIWADVTLGQCTASDTIDVNYLNALSLDLGNDTTLCPGATIILTAQIPGGVTTWNTGANTNFLTVGTPGNYWATVNVSGCSVSDTISVGFTPLIPFSLGANATICEGTSAMLNASSPGALITWQDGTIGNTYTATVAGQYTATATLGNCSYSDMIEVFVNPIPAVDLGPDTALCADAFIVLDVETFGGSYQWSNGSSAPTILTGPGVWGVSVSVSGCVGTDTITITELPTPVVYLGSDTTLCTAAVWNVNVSQSNATYLWQDGTTDPLYTIDAPGPYSVTVNIGGCTASDQVNVNYFDPSVVELGPDTTLCPSEELLLAINVPGAEITWQDGSDNSTYLVTSAGTYSAVVNVGGCQVTDDITVNVTPLIAPDFGDDRTLCEGDTLLLFVEPGTGSVQWNTGSTADSIYVTTTSDPQVTVSLDGCSASDEVNVTFIPRIDAITIIGDTTICPGQMNTLSADVVSGALVWSTGDEGPTTSILLPGVYTVSIEGMCANATDTIEVVEGNCQPMVNVPNAFSPDGDGINEWFAPVVYGNFTDYRFMIFDRWGEQIFSTDQPGVAWDGNYGGTEAKIGVYVWTLEYKALTDEGVDQQRLNGSVTLLR